MKPIETFLFGIVPYYYSRLSGKKSPETRYYEYIARNGYSRHLYLFGKEYRSFEVDIKQDPDKDLPFVLHRGRRLYFRRDMDPKRIAGLYRALVMEQDYRSPHRYLRDERETDGCTILDIGAAEGIFSLESADRAGKIFLFECEEPWIEALQATFEPWKEKVEIINRYVGAVTDDTHLRLDDFIRERQEDSSAPFFLKMDIEGAEREALRGAEQLLSRRGTVRFAVCAYHRNDDEKVLSRFFDRLGIRYHIQRGYFNRRTRAFLFRDTAGTENTSSYCDLES